MHHVLPTGLTLSWFLTSAIRKRESSNRQVRLFKNCEIRMKIDKEIAKIKTAAFCSEKQLKLQSRFYKVAQLHKTS